MQNDIGFPSYDRIEFGFDYNQFAALTDQELAQRLESLDALANYAESMQTHGVGLAVAALVSSAVPAGRVIEAARVLGIDVVPEMTSAMSPGELAVEIAATRGIAEQAHAARREISQILEDRQENPYSAGFVGSGDSLYGANYDGDIDNPERENTWTSWDGTVHPSRPTITD